jgi:hypothetical protein
MVDEGSAQPSVSLSELSGLRSQTEAIAELLRKRLERHLEVIRILTAPRRLLGRFMGGSASRDDVAGADKTAEALARTYKQVVGAPFVLKPQLDYDAFKLIDSRLEIHPWEYSHEARAGSQSNVIDITSPGRWVVNYACDTSFSQLRQVLAGKEEKRPDNMRQFVLSSLVLKAVFEKFPAIVQLLADLRFQLSFEKAPGMGELELVTVRSEIPVFRPPADLILTATGVSGVNAFIELIDRDAVQQLRDPLLEEISAALG